jgi:hypothetical protein
MNFIVLSPNFKLEAGHFNRYLNPALLVHRTSDCKIDMQRDLFLSLDLAIGEKSLFHSLTPKKANEKRTLVETPDFANHHGGRPMKRLQNG